jgi:RNA recognition motif-containing protein
MKLADFPMTVLISDPAAKTKRSDADDSANRTLFVGGLTGRTTEGDVQALLADHGAVQHVKLGWDPIKRECRGFAFVEMASEVGLSRGGVAECRPRPSQPAH